MKIRVINITSDSEVKVKTAIGTVIIKSQEMLQLGKNEVGFLEGKRKHHQQGVFMQGGIINAGWGGHLTIEFLVTGEISINKGDEIAHAIILTADDDVIYERNEAEIS